MNAESVFCFFPADFIDKYYNSIVERSKAQVCKKEIN